MRGGPAVQHDGAELSAPAQEQVTLRTSSSVSGLEMLPSAFLLS